MFKLKRKYFSRPQAIPNRPLFKDLWVNPFIDKNRIELVSVESAVALIQYTFKNMTFELFSKTKRMKIVEQHFGEFTCT